MHDHQTRSPIHAADCACPRCDPLLHRQRQRTHLEIGVCALIVAASFVGVALAVFGTN